MEMAYRGRWEAEIAEMRRVLGGLGMKEECKWGKPTYTVGGKNIVIMHGFKEYFGLGFFQGALLQDPKKVEKLVNRFLLTFEANNATSDPRLALFGSGSTSISGNTLATLGQLRSRRRG